MGTWTQERKKRQKPKLKQPNHPQFAFFPPFFVPVFFQPQTFNAMLACELFPVANNTLHCCSAFNPKISKCFAGINELSLITPL